MPATDHFLLVHGAWHGGWCWEKVIPLLRGEGYEAIAPALSGLGERSDLLSPDINLSTHVNDIVEVLEKNNLRNVALVGHSYAGMVVSSAASAVPERIGRLIYLDAALPFGAQSVVDLAPGFSRLVREMETPRGVVPVIPAPTPEAFGITGPDDIARAKSRLTPMPYKALTEKTRPLQPAAARIPVSCILCAQQFSPVTRSAHLAAFRRFQAVGQDCRKIDAPHDMMITHPRELSDMLIDCIGSTR
jgi:pimeloyl-ACP methyl ester carboxylesterase